MKVWKAASVSVNQGSRVVTVTTGDAIDSITINSWIQIGSSLPYEVKRGFLDGSTKKIELFEPWQGSNLSAQRAIAFPTRSEIEQLTQNVRDLIQSIETLENYSEFTRDSVVNLNDAASWRAALQVIGETDTLTTSTGLSGGGNMSVNRTISVDASTGVLGEGSGEVRSNLELDSRYLKKDDISDASLVLDFVNNDYRVLENGILTKKSFGDILTITRNSTKSINFFGKIKEVGPNLPAYSYSDAFGTMPLSIHEARTNLVLNSASGQYGNPPGSESFTLAPDNTNTAVIPVVNDNADRFQNTIPASTFSSGTILTCSWFEKKLNYSGTGSMASVSSSVNINLITSGAETYANGWARYWQSFSIIDGSLESIFRYYFGSNFGAGIENQGAFWGHQLEVGSFPSPYIPTAGSQVTRAADVVIIDDITPWFNPQQGTFVVEFDTASIPYLIMLTDPTGSYYTNLIELRVGSNTKIRTTVRNGDVTIGITNTANTITSGRNKAAFSFTGSRLAVSLNGEAVASVNLTGALPSTINRLYIGGFRDNANYLNGSIANIKYQHLAASDAELQQRSAL